MEYMDGPEYDKIRIQQQKEFKVLVKQLTGG